MILPVIMAGGSGSRLWPLSRQSFPKQFLALHGESTLLQTTLTRLHQLPHQAPMVICNEEHRFVVAEQLRSAKLNYDQILLEPEGRNTAPAIALAAFHAVNQGRDPLLLVLPADHIIDDESAFIQAISQATLAANNNKLVTFGIIPTAPETGYGYIQASHPMDNGYIVDKFIEKPDLISAKNYVSQNDFFWNSGIFLFKASVFLAQLKLYRPQIYHACHAAMANTCQDIDFLRIDPVPFKQCPSESIDYAVMENTAQAVVIPMSAQWSDIGSWSALWEVADKDPQGNAIRGDVVCIDTTNSYINAQDKLVTAIGVDNIVIVATKDAILVSDKSQSQQIKSLVDTLTSQQRHEVIQQREVYRPWGKYNELDEGTGFKVKRITVKPNGRLSTQLHRHRAEHWIVVKGTAKVTNGDKEIVLQENQSTYIPVGHIHTLENPTTQDLELIEVQSGHYLSEDDIVRFDDKYGRI